MLKKALLTLAGCAVAFAQAPAVDDQTLVRIEALKRLKGVDLEANPAVRGAVQKVLEKTRGTPHYVELVREFELKGHGQELLDYALKFPNETSGVDAFRLATSELGPATVEGLLASEKGPAAIQLIGNSSDRELQQLLRAALRNNKATPAVRRESAKALAKSEDGARYLLELAAKDELPNEARFTASSALNLAPWPEVKKRAAELLPLPQSQNAEPLPPVAELIKRNGNPKRGAEVFESATAACATCHQVNGKGIDFGPSLSEIGTKLGKEALYESILDPSAGISFGYEAWSVELNNGDEAFGLLASETADELAIKSQNGVTTKFKKSDIAKRQKLATSIMPSGLQLTMSTQDLVDLVEYLASLRKHGQ